MTKYFNRTAYEQQEGDLEKQSINELNKLNQIANAPDGDKQVEIKLNEMIKEGVKLHLSHQKCGLNQKNYIEKKNHECMS